MTQGEQQLSFVLTQKPENEDVLPIDIIESTKKNFSKDVDVLLFTGYNVRN